MSLPRTELRAEECRREHDVAVKRNLVPIPPHFAVRSRAVCVTSSASESLPKE